MAWLAVDKDEKEFIHEFEQIRGFDFWFNFDCNIELPKGSIKKLIGKELTWDDEPFEIK